MRGLLGTLAAMMLVAGTVVTAGAPAGAQDTTTTLAESTTTTTIEPTTTDPTTTSTTTTSTTTTSTTTSTVAPPLVGELPSQPVGPRRGTQIQVTDTQPPPPSTTTMPPAWVLPENSGEGRRVVYSKTRQRVWTVEADGTVSKTHLVSGRRTWNQPLPGTYSVFSRSSYTCNIKNPDICWRYMVRFTKGPEGDNIGFHEIPTNIETGYKLQSESQLGTALSGGCIRQATPDAIHIWNWAPIGTRVVVLP